MKLKFNTKLFLKTIIPLIVIFFNFNIVSQTITPTNGESNICGECTPPGWTFSTGTPDVSNRTTTGGNFKAPQTGGSLGYNAKWSSDGTTQITLPAPPTGHSTWISLRDVGPNFDEEFVQTVISGLQPNKLYKLTMYTISPRTDDSGPDGNFYAGTKMNQFDYSITANGVEQARQSLTILSATTWNATQFVFLTPAILDGVGSDEVTLNLYPRKDGNYSREWLEEAQDGTRLNNSPAYNGDASSSALEVVNISIGGSVSPISRLDTDGDGVYDDDDIDDDNDGILDTAEYPSALDHDGDEDGDGVPNYLDVSDDNGGGSIGTDYSDLNGDGIPDAYDFDRDGIPNHVDLDADNDGILDIKEAQTHIAANYIAATGSVGSNGYYDVFETSADSGTPQFIPVNTDGDNANLFKPDFLDIDADNDGIPDIVEAHSTSDYQNSLPTGNVGINGVDSRYESVDTYSPTAVTAIVDTDLDLIPDYRDTDSDNDGTSDLLESGFSNTLSGNDSDGDGLDDNQDLTDTAFTNGVSNYDATNGIDDTETDLAETENPNDVTTGGDVDFRDDVTGIDTDGDKVPDSIDLDDDNDGILDTLECTTGAIVPAGGANAITVDVGVARETEILDGVTGGQQGARFNNTNDVLVLQLRAGNAIVPSGTAITITTTASNTAAKRLRFQQSDAAGNNTSNNWDAAYNSATTEDQNFTGSGSANVFIVNYVLASDATHIKISMLERAGSRINIDYLEYASFGGGCSDVDTDGDGIVDRLDIDADNDGIIDNVEAQSTAGYVAPNSDSFATYTTNNGVNSAYIPSASPITPVNTDNGGSFTNKDNKPDYLDLDSDNDGIPDNIEAQPTTTYVNFVAIPGTDKNGLSSAYDFSDNFTALGLSGSLVNTDGDAEPDYRDQDSDGDATDDVDEGLSSITAGSFGTDTDGDGLDDIYEHGTTNDGFVVNDGLTNPKGSGFIDVDTDVLTGGDLDYRDDLVGTDTDGDGIVDSIDIDDDNDGILDSVEGNGDFDNDGIINSLDLDSDGDGILDIIESQPNTGATTLSGNDADNDGLDDNFDATPNGGAAGSNGTTPTVTTAVDSTPDYLDIDADDDGITDNIEAQTTQGYVVPTGNVGLNGVDSAYENNDTFDPTGLTLPNTDTTLSNNADTIPDYRDTDSDGDGTLDNAEGLNPTPSGTLGTDTDGDGLDDVYENGTTNDGAIVNDGITDPVNTLLDADNDGNSTGDVDYRDIDVILDNDGDGIIDSIDLDDDNDGILDSVEGTGDFDNDGIIDSFDIDADNDGIPDNIEAQSTTGYIAPNADSPATYTANNGVNSAYLGGLTPQNTDNITGNNNDTDPDYKDLDSDGDGTIDRLEAGFGTAASGNDADNDGLDDVFEHGSTMDGFVVNDGINTPISSLPDEDSDAAIASTNPPAENYNDLDYRDIDDDRTPTVAAGHLLWLRADIDLDGSSWEDQTGSGATKFDATPSNSPTINITGANTLNFNPTVTLNGTNQRYSITNGIFGNSANNDVLWIYAVSLRNSGDGNIFGQNLSGNDINFQAPNGGNLSFSPGTGNTITNAWGGTDNKFHIWNAGYDNNTGSPPSGENTTLYRDGREIDSDNNTGNFDGNNGNAFIGSDTNNNFMNGQIAELMVYTSVPTSAEQQQIQSYLAIKYGITLDNIVDNDATIIEGDYTLLDGTKVWNKTNNNTYHNDVAGIGREDGMLLTQKQSKSINSDAVITIGLNSIAANNTSNTGSIAANKSFLMWGNNGASLTTTTTSTLVCSDEKQLDRVWKIVETGSIGSVQIAITRATVGTFDIDNVLNTANTIKVLKIADDANFTTNVKHLPLTSVNINGTDHFVTNYDFDGTKYFTYSEINGIFWNGDANAWTGGANPGNSAPSELAADEDKVLVIDAETTAKNARMTISATVGCVWVKANSKLVVNNNRFIQFDGKLILDGEIRLIGDAQLVQTHTGVSNVEGNGKLYRDQKSYLPNVYRYNYWSSPVVKALGNTSYKVADVMKDGTAPTTETSTIKDITFKTYSQLSDLNGETTDPIKIASYWIYSYFDSNGERGGWVQQGHTGDINIAEGYIMKSTGRSPQNYTFVGTPNDGTYTKTVAASTSSLVGNPYPSVIDTQKFIQDNSAVIDGTLYFWEHKGESTTTNVQVEGHGKYGYEGGYSQRNQAMGVAANSVIEGTAGLGNSSYTAPPQYIAVGQGFFVSAPSNKGGTFSFKNSQRTYSANNIFFKGKTNNALPNFKLGFDYTNDSNTGIHRQLGINFKAGNTFSYESGFDSETFDLQATDVYWNFSEIESNLIIAGVGELSAQLQIPLGFTIDTDKPVTLMIDEKENMENYAIYLVDLLTGQIFNMKQPKVLNLAKGTYEDRFILIFGGTALGIDDEVLLNKVFVYADNTNNELVIKNNNNQIINKVEFYNLLGQKVSTIKNIETKFENRISTKNLASSIYIVKVFTEKGIISKKISINNN